MSRTFLLWGPAGTGKTTFALEDATPENPVAYKELEPGGFRRAARRLKLSEGAVQVDTYPTPMQELETLLAGMPELGDKGGLKADFSYNLDGWVQLLNDLVMSTMETSKAGMRPVFDTGTRFWYIVRQAYEEMVQKATGANIDKIGQLKFTWPNKIHLQVHEFPMAYNLDVIWIAHEAKVFNSDPPIYNPDCWRELEGMVDCSLRFRVVDNKPIARIDKGAEVGMLLKYLDVPEPSLKKLNTILDIAPILQEEGESMENIRDVDFLLRMGKLRGL